MLVRISLGPKNHFPGKHIAVNFHQLYPKTSHSCLQKLHTRFSRLLVLVLCLKADHVFVKQIQSICQRIRLLDLLAKHKRNEKKNSTYPKVYTDPYIYFTTFLPPQKETSLPTIIFQWLCETLGIPPKMPEKFRFRNSLRKSSWKTLDVLTFVQPKN